MNIKFYTVNFIHELKLSDTQKLYGCGRTRTCNRSPTPYPLGHTTRYELPYIFHD